jgi:hypothetical protein
MPFQYLTNFPLDEAAQIYLDALASRGLTYKTETIPVTAALGRITAKRSTPKSARRIITPALWTVSPWMPPKLSAPAKPRPPPAESDFVRVDTGDPARRLRRGGDDRGRIEESGWSRSNTRRTLGEHPPDR